MQLPRAARLAALAFIWLSSVGDAAADDAPFGVALLRPDSLVGWDYGEQPVRGWTIADGKLTGRSDAAPLLSGFSFGDFELRLSWSAAEGGACRLTLPDVPEGQGLALVLEEGDACARLTDGEKELAPGGKIEGGPDAVHTATLRRAGGKLSVSVDGREPCEVPIDPKRRFGLGLAVVRGSVTLADLRVEEPIGEPLVKNDLSGWWCPGNLNAWKVENGELVLHERGGNYIRTERDYGNFTLTMDYLIRKNGNSGIGIRTPHDGWPSGDGMEIQIEDRPGLNKHRTAAIYGNVPPIARADKSEEWNRVVVKADGWMITVWCNGEMVQHCNTRHHPELKHRNLAGWIGFQDHGAWIRVRDLRVREARDGKGLAAWAAAPPKRATTALVDRLMNPERITVPDGITSGVVSKTIAAEEPGDHVLAELTGPGAIVRFARGGENGDDGTLAFYFDGEAEPRIECKPSDVRGALPPLSEDRNPVPTCLCYEKSLKVVLREAEQGSFRIDYVGFPNDYRIETYRDPHSGFPRGWLAPVDYRLGQCRWGVVRQHDPMPKFEGGPATLPPGESASLLEVDGPGIVRYLKLPGARPWLASGDLWLEVTVDDEPAPSLAAPVRFLIPGLVAEGRYGNFLWTDRGGPIVRLPIPFVKKLKIAARNCGPKPIENLSAQLCVESVPADEAASRLRLRARFLAAGDSAGGQLFAEEGRGRWVGLVYQEHEGQTTGIERLEVDGKPADGWASQSLDLFLGAPGEFRRALSGRREGLAWRNMLLAPVEFEKSITLKAAGAQLGARLVLFYVAK